MRVYRGVLLALITCFTGCKNQDMERRAAGLQTVNRKSRLQGEILYLYSFQGKTP